MTRLKRKLIVLLLALFVSSGTFFVSNYELRHSGFEPPRESIQLNTANAPLNTANAPSASVEPTLHLPPGVEAAEREIEAQPNEILVFLKSATGFCKNNKEGFDCHNIAETVISNIASEELLRRRFDSTTNIERASAEAAIESADAAQKSSLMASSVITATAWSLAISCGSLFIALLDLLWSNTGVQPRHRTSDAIFEERLPPAL